MDIVVEAPREVHSKEGIAGIWDGVDETVNEIRTSRRNLVVLPPEGDYLGI